MSKNKKKRILLVTQYFYPENFKSNDIAFELVKRGYEVDALVSIPNYPEGRYYKGYGLFQKRIERINGVKVYRAFQTPRGRKATGLGLSLNYLTYAFFASIWALFFSLFKRKYHSIIVFQTSPITQALPAVVIAKSRKTPIYLWVQDLWPEALISGKNINNKLAVKLIDKLTTFIYNNSKTILVSSKLFADAISLKGNYKDKLKYFPNWSDDFLENYKEVQISLPDGFIISLAGNLGVSQDLESIVNLALELRDEKSVKILLIGDGSKKEWVENEINRLDLHDRLLCLGRLPYNAMPYLYAKSNAMLLTLNADYEDLKMVVPSRLQSYMSASRPVLAMIEGGAADIIKEAKCGYVVNGSDYMGLANIIKEKVLVNKKAFEGLGLNGRDYFEQNFQKDKCINNLCSIIEE